MTEKNEKKIKESAFDRLNDEQKAAQIPYYVHEMEMARSERTIMRLWIALIIAIVALVGMFIYEAQFETYTYEQETRADNAPAVGILNTGEGDVTYNGDGETKNQNPGEEEQFKEPDEGVPYL